MVPASTGRLVRCPSTGFNALTGFYDFMQPCGLKEAALRIHSLPAHPDETKKIDWVIAGSESGPNARPVHPDWIRGLRDQCASAGVPFFFKQWGSWRVIYDADRDDPDGRRPPNPEYVAGRYLNFSGGHGFHGARVTFVQRASKSATGAILDGQEHKAFPA
jgi:hypothetical protein